MTTSFETAEPEENPLNALGKINACTTERPGLRILGQTIGGAVTDGLAAMGADNPANASSVTIPGGSLPALLLVSDLGIVQMFSQGYDNLKAFISSYVGSSPPDEAIVVTGTRLPPKHGGLWKFFDTLGFHKGGFFYNLWKTAPRSSARMPVYVGPPTTRSYSPNYPVMTGISASNSILPFAYAYRVGEAKATINAASANWEAGNYGRAILGYIGGNVQKGTILFSGTSDLVRARYFGRADPGPGDRETTDLLLGVGSLAAGELGAVSRAARISPMISQPGLYSLEAPIVHGNSFQSTRTTWLYELYTGDGQFLKYGISQNPATRYSKAFMADKDIYQITSGSRADMFALERQMVTENPGPLNFEPWAVKAREGN